MTLGIRRLIVLGSLSASDVLLWSRLSGDRAGGPDLTAALTAGAVWALQGGLAWLTVLTALLLAEPLAGRRLTAYAGCPEGLRRVLLVACGLAMAGGLVAPSYAESPPSPSPSPAAVSVDGLPLPDRAAGAAPRARPPRAPAVPVDHPDRPRRPAHPAHPARPDRTVVVRPGDCLWSIARAALVAAGERPAEADVAHAWRAVYAANRARIGADPGLIRPGTVLRIPDPTTWRGTDR